MCDERSMQGNHNGAETIMHYANMPLEIKAAVKLLASKLVRRVFAELGSVLMHLVQ